MHTLVWICLASFAGAVLSVVAAGVVSLNSRAQAVPALISFAVGALLGAAFLDVLPEAIEGFDSAGGAMATVLAGILMFFVLEKLVLWRHCHEESCEGHDVHTHEHGESRGGQLILIGDTVHNFVDGVLIAAAFVQSVPLGVITAAAIVAHEIPQEVGDFIILLHSGYSRARAFAFNLLSSLATLVGGALGYFALDTAREWIPTLLALAASSMIYVAVADLIPGLHKRPEIRAGLQQMLLIGLGVAAIWLVHLSLHDIGV